MRTKLILAGLLLATAAAADLPTDPLQRCATKALRGDFGKLHPWQAAGYKAALTQGVSVQGKAWVTFSGHPRPGAITKGRLT